MRRFASPVTVVTARTEAESRGITIGSFTSVSLEPPLVSFNIHKEADTHDVLLKAGRFSVHLLTEEQSFLAHHFARPDLTPEEQFEPVTFYEKNGLIHLSSIQTIFDCELVNAYDASDHTIVVGEVIGVYVEGEPKRPVLYFNQSYRRVGQEVKGSAFSPVKRSSSESS